MANIYAYRYTVLRLGKTKDISEVTCLGARFLNLVLKRTLHPSAKNPFEDSALEIFVIYLFTEIKLQVCSFFKETVS